MDRINGVSCYLSKCLTLSNTSQMTIQEDSALVHCALCVQHSPTAAALSTSFLLNHAPPTARAERIDYRIWGVIGVTRWRGGATVRRWTCDQ